MIGWGVGVGLGVEVWIIGWVVGITEGTFTDVWLITTGVCGMIGVTTCACIIAGVWRDATLGCDVFVWMTEGVVIGVSSVGVTTESTVGTDGVINTGVIGIGTGVVCMVGSWVVSIDCTTGIGVVLGVIWVQKMSQRSISGIGGLLGCTGLVLLVIVLVSIMVCIELIL